MRTFGTLAFTALLICGAAAQSQLLPPPVLLPPPMLLPAPTIATPVSETSFHGYGDRDQSCAEWTDSCRTCRRSGAGAYACSNIGPTCQPGAITCARKVEPAAPQ